MSEAGATSARGGRAAKQSRDDKPGLGARLSLFYRQVIAELRKVIWPTRKELITYSYVVIVFVAVVALYVAGLDLVFARLVLTVFGGGGS